MINDYINQLNMEWNKKIESVQDTIVADILEGLWAVSYTHLRAHET